MVTRHDSGKQSSEVSSAGWLQVMELERRHVNVEHTLSDPETPFELDTSRRTFTSINGLLLTSIASAAGSCKVVC